MTDKVLGGYVMPHPHTKLPLPDYVYDVMKTCWEYFASERSSFAHVYSLLVPDSRARSTHSREVELLTLPIFNTT